MEDFLWISLVVAKGGAKAKAGNAPPGAVLLENVPGFLSEDIIRALFSEWEVQVKSVKFWVLSNRGAKRPLTRFAEVEVFSDRAAEEIAVYLD